MKYRLDKKELLEHWGNHLDFIQSSMLEFDRGNEKKLEELLQVLELSSMRDLLHTH